MDNMIGITDREFEFPDEAVDESTLRIDGWSPAPPRRPGGDAVPPWLPGAAAFVAGMAAGAALFGRRRHGRALLALALGLGGAALLGGRRVFAVRYDIAELNEPPVEAPTVPVDGHGVVHRGRTDVPQDGGGNRPYLWIWLVPDPDSECLSTGSYRWYQFVRPRLFIDGRPKRDRRRFKAATGLEYALDEWNPDYHVSEVGPGDAAFAPGGLGLAADRAGKPFRHYDIPGTDTGGGTSRLTGVLDAPNFCVRSDDGLSQAERFLGRFIKPHEREAEQPQAPPERNVQVRIEVEGCTYLVCVGNGAPQCVGFVAWRYVNDVAVRLVWREAGIAAGTNRRWKLGSQLVRCASSLTIGDWTQPC